MSQKSRRYWTISNPAVWPRASLEKRWHELRQSMQERNYQDSHKNWEFDLIDAYLFS